MKLEELRKNIGDELFNQLSDSDKKFMSETAGSIKTETPVNLNKLLEDSN